MDKLTDSDITMLAGTSFDNILHQIQSSCLNYKLKITPFSAFISIKKSFVKDKEGYAVIPDDVKSSAIFDLSNQDARNDINLKEELNQLKTKQMEYIKELKSVYTLVDELRNTIEERDSAINDILTQRMVHKEAAGTVSKTLKPSQFEFDALQCDMMKTDIEKFKSLDLEAVKVEQASSLGENSECYCGFATKLEVQDYDASSNSTSNYFNHDGNYASTMKVESHCLSLVSHWYPFSMSYSSDNNSGIGNLFSIPSVRAHYVKLPKPGEAFSSLTHMDEEFRQLLRARRGGQECRQS